MPAAPAPAWRQLAEALAAVARIALPEVWRRYCALAAAHDPGAASPDDAGLRRLRQHRGTKYLEAGGSAALAEAMRLEGEFAAALIAELAAGRWEAAATSERDTRYRPIAAGTWTIAGIDLDPEKSNVVILGAPRLLGLRLRPASEPASRKLGPEVGRVVRAMRADLDGGKLTYEALAATTQKELAARYRSSERTCRRARDLILRQGR